MKTTLTNEDISRIIELYDREIKSTHKLGELFNVGHKKITQILKDNNISINKKGGQIQSGNSKIMEKSKTNRYESNSENKKLIAVCKKTYKEFDDVNNLSGALTRHILDVYGDVGIPATNYLRKKYEFENKEKWFEKYFIIVEKDADQVRKCKICDWETTDHLNKTGCFEGHLISEHNLNLKDYLLQFPEDLIYHKSFNTNKERETLFLNDENYVMCKLCNQKMKVISNTHLRNKHNITSHEYKLLFPNTKLSSNTSSLIFKNNAIIGNMNAHPTWTSSGEIEIKKYIESLGIDAEKSKNRKLLEGKEIDIIIPSNKLAIEYDGLYFHTERMGKNSTYHLDKTIACFDAGYKLIHIFEDEWILNKNLVKNKLKHLLNINNGIKIGARNTIIKIVKSKEKSQFLNENHIQGNDSSKIFYGAYYNNELVGVMTFKDQRNMTKTVDGEYELSRYAVKQNFIIMGLASKFIKAFIKDFSPLSIISFADRRWTPIAENNLYTNIGFKLVDVLDPTYFYYSSKIDRYKRFHKFGFGKNSLKLKFPYLDFSKSEKQLMAELGYDRIWDCGLFKYQLVI